MLDPRVTGVVPVSALLALVLGLFAGACGGDDEPSFTITNPGTGEPNDAPLLPLGLGFRTMAPGFDTKNGSVIDSVDVIGDARTYRLSAPGSIEYTRYLVDTHGVFYAGSTYDARVRRPVLIVPAEVRLGMAWTATTDDETEVRFEVTAREIRTTEFGNLPVWAITNHDPRIHEPDETATNEYIEGYGFADVTHTVFHDVPDLTPPRLPVALLPRMPFEQNGFFTIAPSLVRFGEGPALFLGGHPGQQIGVCHLITEDGVDPERPPRAYGPFGQGTELSCIESSYCVETMSGNNNCIMYQSGDASGIHVAPDGTLSWIPRSQYGGGVVNTMLEGVGEIDNLARYRAHAIIGGVNGGPPRVLYGSASGLGTLYLDEEMVHAQQQSPQVPVHNDWALHEAWDRQITFPHADGSATFLLRDGRDLLWTSHITKEGVMSRPRVGAYLSGTLSVQSNERGTEVLRVTGDGQIDLLIVDAAATRTLELARVANVDVPPGEIAVGAWRLVDGDGHHLLLATIAENEHALLENRLYRTERLPAPVPAPLSDALRIYTGEANAGLFVCWPEDVSATSVGEDWGPWYDDEPTARVLWRTGASCAVGIQTHGTIPGAGRMSIRGSSTREMSLDSYAAAMRPPEHDPVLAPLAGGGFVGGRYLIEPGGILGPRSPLGELRSSAQREVIDLGGGGLWVFTDGADDELLLLNRASRLMPSPDGTPMRFELAVGGGGVVVSTAGRSAWWRVGADGTFTALALTIPATILPGALFPDGTLCGDVANLWTCYRPGGAVVVADKPGVAPYPLADGSLFQPETAARPGTVRLSTIGAVTDYAVTVRPNFAGVEVFAHRADGHLYMTAAGPGSRRTLYRVTGTDYEELLILDGAFGANPNDRMLVDEELLLYRIGGGRYWPFFLP